MHWRMGRMGRVGLWGHAHERRMYVCARADSWGADMELAPGRE